MRMTAIRTQTERKRLDRPVRRTEKQGRRASTARSRGSIRPIRVVSATADTARGKKRLIGWPRWAILRSNGKPLGECRNKPVYVAYEGKEEFFVRKEGSSQPLSRAEEHIWAKDRW